MVEDGFEERGYFTQHKKSFGRIVEEGDEKEAVSEDYG